MENKNFFDNQKKSFIERVKDITGRKMRPELHLVNTIEFRLAVFTPLAVALAVGCFASAGEELRFSFSPEGMDNFLNLFKLPIGLASLALPITAVVAANHRSMQTAQQIKSQDSQNIFANHLEHRKHFLEFMGENEPFKNIKINRSKIYDSFFPSAVDGDLSPDKNTLNFSMTALQDINITIKEHLKKTDEKTKILTFDEALLSDFKSYNSKMNKIITDTQDSLMQLEAELAFFCVIKAISTSQIILNGIILCINFHRFYYSSEDLNSEAIENEIKENKNRFDEFRESHQVYMDIINLLDNLRDTYFRQQDREKRRELTEEIRKSLMKIENKNLDRFKSQLEFHHLIDDIFYNNLTQEQKSMVMKSLPHHWHLA